MTANIINLQGYHFECSCGERFNNVASASVCKKCRSYSLFGYTKYVIDLRSGDVVHGELPSDEEYQEADAEFERQELLTKLENQLWEQENARALAQYEAEMQELAERAAQKRCEDDEDALWDIQDRLSC